MRIIPIDQKNFRLFDVEIYKDLDEISKNVYKEVIPFRQLMNLSSRVQKMEDLKPILETNSVLIKYFSTKIS